MEQEQKSKHRSYCFTINSTHDTTEIEKVLKERGATYYIIGKEVGDETKREHLQGYAHFKTPRAFKAVIEYYKGWHIEVCKGSADDNIKYCSKGGNFIEFGERPKQGKRSDVEAVKTAMLAGTPIHDVVRDHVTNYQTLKFAEGLQKYQQIRRRTEQKEVIWIYGPTGVGKTRKAFESACDDFWMSGRDLKWFDGYHGQTDVIIDDFRKDFCTFHMLLRLLDIYPMRVEVKGGSVNWTPKRVFITSCYAPQHVYDTREDVGQLLRRISSIIKMEQEQGTEVGGNTIPRPPDVPDLDD